MTPSRPYLIRAIYEWIVDNGYTPYLLVDAEGEGLQAPTEYAEKGKLVLNVSPKAVKVLELGNEAVQFSARFGSETMQVYVPVMLVLAIYARENGQGMLFSEHGDDDGTTGGNSGNGKPSLRVVK